MSATHYSIADLEAGLETVLASPTDAGRIEMIIRRPRQFEREVIESAELDLVEGLKGDNWLARGCRKMPDGKANPEAQLTLMNVRALALVAGERERWPLAGDQLIVDLDLSTNNLPPGSRLAIGTALIEVTATPHTGCRYFAERFGDEAVAFVNSPSGKALRLRGANARIVQPGVVKVGDLARKCSS